MDDNSSVRLIEALSRVWMRIRFFHSEVPPVVLLPAPAPRGQGNVLGHFAALRWKGKKDGDDHLHEVVVVAEHLNRAPDQVVETLLHEAAHALNFSRQIHDCSASQYHNAQFRKAAEELGLRVQRVPHYGYAFTTLPPETLEQYADEVMYLERVLIHRKGMRDRPAGPAPPAGDEDGDGDETPTKPTSRLRKAVCACDPPFIIRVAMKTLTDTTIRCDSCGEPFRLN